MASDRTAAEAALGAEPDRPRPPSRRPRGDPMTELSILMPVYNERDTIAAALEQVAEAELPVDAVELIVVDDGSTDGTREWLEAHPLPPSARLLLHDRNRGKGAAIRTALAQATGRFSTIMDADLEYDPANIGPLLDPILCGEADVAYGVRGFEAHTAYSFWYVMGNHL